MVTLILDAVAMIVAMVEVAMTEVMDHQVVVIGEGVVAMTCVTTYLLSSLILPEGSTTKSTG